MRSSVRSPPLSFSFLSAVVIILFLMPPMILRDRWRMYWSTRRRKERAAKAR